MKKNKKERSRESAMRKERSLELLEGMKKKTKGKKGKEK